jgi:S-adenosylmethionine decarboxylase
VNGPAHGFSGSHLLLAYEECAADLDDERLLESALREGIEAAGATVLAFARARFEPQGLSLVFLLGESHASLHAYPEHRSAFLDIFTCGSRCRPERFDEVLRARLAPRRAVSNLVKR